MGVWGTGGGSGPAGYDYVQAGEPEEPTEGQTWYDIDGDSAFVYDGVGWVEMTVVDYAQLSGTPTDTGLPSKNRVSGSESTPTWQYSGESYTVDPARLSSEVYFNIQYHSNHHTATWEIRWYDIENDTETTEQKTVSASSGSGGGGSRTWNKYVKIREVSFVDTNSEGAIDTSARIHYPTIVPHEHGI